MEVSNDLHHATFEEAVLATTFGKFNILIMLLSIAPCFCQVFETASVSYILPVAQCDLGLTLEDKGFLNGMSYSGMIMSGLVWGYLCDILGRKQIMVFGYLLNALFALVGSFSTNITILMISKFFGGFVIVGPYSAFAAYLSEFHSTKYRARIHMVRGFLMSLGNLVLPMMAWIILPQGWDISIFGYFDFHSWNAYLLVCAIAPIASCIAFIFMPESPRFLMSTGRNDAALKIFKTVYAINTGKLRSSYPIKSLVEEKFNGDKKVQRENIMRSLMQGIYQMKPLFCSPYMTKIILVCFNISVLWMSVFSLQLWLPQLFQAINDYQQYHNGTSSDLCIMLEDLNDDHLSLTLDCEVNLDNSSVYINTIIIGVSRITMFGCAGLLVSLLGKKKLLVLMAVGTGCFSSAIYYAKNSETVLTLSSIGNAFGNVCDNLLVTITLELFPTTLRTVALSITLLCGRVAIVVGNIVFPYLLNIGCAPIFFFIGSLAFACSAISFMLPNTENKELK